MIRRLDFHLTSHTPYGPNAPEITPRFFRNPRSISNTSPLNTRGGFDETTWRTDEPFGVGRT